VRTLSLVLILAGFIIPFGAALVAYRRVGRVYQSQGIRGVWPSYPKFTWDDFVACQRDGTT